MSDHVLDSSMLIDCLRAKVDAVSFLTQLSSAVRPTTHVAVVAELLTGARDKRELAVIDSFLAPFQLWSPTEPDGLAALDLYRAHRLSRDVDWPDCQIAATALRLNAEVITLNVKHFAAFPGVRITRPY